MEFFPHDELWLLDNVCLTKKQKKSLGFLKLGPFVLHFSVIYDLPKNKLIQWIITPTDDKLKLMDSGIAFLNYYFAHP